MARAALIALGVATASSFLTAAIPLPFDQQAISPAPAKREQAGGAVFSGTVRAADTGMPIVRALVTWRCGDAMLEAWTTPDGSYEITNVPPGRCYGSASKNGYATQAFGAKRSLDSGNPIEVSPGSTLEQLSFILSPAGVISGRLSDDTGEGIADVSVAALRRSFLTGRLELLPVASSSSPTDDRGEFRIGNLAPGSYYVMALHSDGTTLYPGTNVPDFAARIGVRGGEESAANFRVVPERPVRVSGVVLNSRGEPATSGSLSAETGSLLGPLRGARIESEGRFQLSLPPGDYILTARLRTAETSESVRVRVGIGAADVENLVLPAEPDVALRGRVRRDDGKPLASQVMLRATRLEPKTMVREGLGVPAGPDGTFHLTVPRGRYVLFADGLPSGFTIVEVYREGRPLADGVLDLTNASDAPGVEVVVSAEQPTLEGDVRDENGERLADAAVVIFPEDSRRWPLFRRVMRLQRADQHGRFVARGLPPGTYLAVALEDVDDHEWADPEVLERLVPLGQEVRLDVGRPAAASLTVRRPK
jgi:hypothetical protein